MLSINECSLKIWNVDGCHEHSVRRAMGTINHKTYKTYKT